MPIKERVCIICGNPLTSREQKYCGPKCRYEAAEKRLTKLDTEGKVEVVPGKYLEPEEVEI